MGRPDDAHQTPAPLIILGTGGLAKELWGMCTHAGLKVLGFVAAQTGATTDYCGLPVLGDDAWLLAQPRQNVVIGVGDPKVRRGLLEIYRQSAHNFPVLVHSGTPILGPLRCGPGTTVMPGGVIQPDVSIGQCTHVNMGVTIGHDVQIGDCCVINHNAGISGNVLIGNDVMIGCGAMVLERLAIGDGVTVGAGAVVTHDIPGGVTVVGVPARAR